MNLLIVFLNCLWTWVAKGYHSQGQGTSQLCIVNCFFCLLLPPLPDTISTPISLPPNPWPLKLFFHQPPLQGSFPLLAIISTPAVIAPHLWFRSHLFQIQLNSSWNSFTWPISSLTTLALALYKIGQNLTLDT